MHNFDVLAIFKYLNGILPMHIAILVMLGNPHFKMDDLKSKKLLGVEMKNDPGTDKENLL